MPAQFTLPPDTRAVGTGNPPADMNSMVDALTAMGGTYNVLNAAWAGGADPAGAADSTAAIQAALAAARTAGGAQVQIPPGSYKISGPLRIGSNTTLQLLPGATVTLAAGSACNAIQSWAVQANRRILDGVTNSTTTFTSATASFTSGDTGSQIRIYYQDGTWLDTTIATFTNSTTVVLAAAATVSQAGLYAYLGAGRDSNIKVTGGSWARPLPNGPDSYNGHHLRFRHVDGLEVGNIGGSTADGHFFVSVGDCTKFYVHDVSPSSTFSDTVHINGPSSAGWIERIANPSPGDDVVAFTCGDINAYADVMGNITDITAQGIRVPAVSAAHPTTVKILAGSSTTGTGYLIDRINVHDAKSMISGNYTVNVCNDLGGPYTQGGTWGSIILQEIVNISPTSTSPAVNVVGAAVTDLHVRESFNVNPANYTVLSVQSTALVTRLQTNLDRSKVNLVTGSKVTWIDEAQADETPFTQPAAVYGDGSSISATVADAAALDITGGLSIEMWLNPAPSQVAFWTPLAKLGQYWFEGGGSGQTFLTFTIVHGGGNTSASSAAMQPGRLNHVVGVFTPSTSVVIWLNGVASGNVTSIPATVDTSTNTLYLLNRQGFSRFTSGQVADVRIWKGALSPGDIAAHFADPGNLGTTTTATLAARWKCDEGTGTTLGDSSGGGNNATLSSASWNPPASPYLVQPQLATGAGHTVDDVITALQKIGLVHQ